MERKPRILFIEDDPNLAFVIKDNLIENGYKDGENSFFAKQYALCLFDIMLPKKDGFSVAETIRKKDQKTPIIFLSAKEQQEDKNFGLRIGADDYITKPFDFDEQQMKVYEATKETETFRFIEWDDFSSASVTLPIDKIVASLIKASH